MTKNRLPTSLLIATIVSGILSCSENSEHSAEKLVQHSTSAPGAPGTASTWSFSGKSGIGTSYERYVNGQHRGNPDTGNVSKVWFSIANGVLTETMYGLIHEAQLKDMQLVVVGENFVDIESTDTISSIDYLYKDSTGRPLSLAYKITNIDKDGLYIIEKSIFTHPDTQAVFHRIVFTPNVPGLKLYLQANPHIGNTGEGDIAWTDGEGLHAQEGNTTMSIVSHKGWHNPTVGFVGVSDLRSDLVDGKQDWVYPSTGDASGNIALGAELTTSANQPTTFDVVIGFGEQQSDSVAAAIMALDDGYERSLQKYNGEGSAVGWQDYLESLSGLKEIRPSSTDNGKLLNVSALVLKAQEDKTFSGALIASLSNPWGDTVSAAQFSTGYKAVWPRDFYQCAMAFLALGDTETPLVAFQYLKNVQVTKNTKGSKGVTGWFLQKTHVDGTLEWIAVQLDQTAMPIMLGWKLWQQDVLSDKSLKYWYDTMLKNAATFLIEGGTVNLDWNTATVKPPFTQQERWEEQGGYSPSSIAATVTGLVSAAEIASHLGDSDSATLFLQTADQYEQSIEALTYTKQGRYQGDDGNSEYYLRITQNSNPNDEGKLADRNGRGVLSENAILDGGFLELVRYGVRAANDPHILSTIENLDDETIADDYRVKYSFETNGYIFPGWRRYGMDGYGEDEDTGKAYSETGKHTPGQRGRVWPFFTGERGHYELAKGATSEHLKNTFVAAMEFFANEGLMLPEQVWDGVGVDTAHNFAMGEGTNSATPLAWTHAEYVKLLRSVADEAVWDSYPPVVSRYQNK
ncbi:glucan 1,4-alpha-glucosidase [Teredinibacter haidensis]|uniref:glucan 1,4-alpha-glucosidase n=1 Tax=Teredinibacter haidensis TaxID=2731755 RepID=UPI000948BE98|nr:glucan 1,4-alpha-glucosidase [Teredinibacter haidensis]